MQNRAFLEIRFENMMTKESEVKIFKNISRAGIHC